MNLFYEPSIDALGQYEIATQESSHIAKVFRHKIGDAISLTNGNGSLFEATIADINKKHCTVDVSKAIEHNEQKPLLHIAIAPTKNIDRFEWFLEKVTEIGIGKITPILTARSERKNIKAERLERVLIAAMKQSQSTFLPKLNPLVKFNDFIKIAFDEEQKLIAACNDDDKKTLKEVINKGKPSLVLIGPEGDFTNDEIKLALANNYKLITLGDKRLRTETAGIVACNLINFLNE